MDEVGDGVQHAHWVTLVQGLAQLLQSVQVLQVVLGFIGGICDAGIKLTPCLEGGVADVFMMTVVMAECSLP